jgi:hypothetical protein
MRAQWPSCAKTVLNINSNSGSYSNILKCMWCNWHRMHSKIFEQLQKSKIICKTAMLCKKIKNTCNVIDTACTIVERLERAGWHPLKGIYISKTFRFPNCPTPTLQKIERSGDFFTRTTAIYDSFRQKCSILGKFTAKGLRIQGRR